MRACGRMALHGDGLITPRATSIERLSIFQLSWSRP